MKATKEMTAAKQIKSILLTVIYAMVILAAGYMGIVVSGQELLKTSDELMPVNLSGNISRLFYSTLEDDIQLFPWNLYPSQEEIAAQQEQGFVPFSGYDPHIEVDVFYSMISLAAGVDVQEVIQWYDKQNKTIMLSMVAGRADASNMDIYFYQDELQLGGKNYEVKIACNDYSIISFSCLQILADGIKDTQEWEENKKGFLTWMEEKPEEVEAMFSIMQELHNYDLVYGQDAWGEHEKLYLLEGVQEESGISQGSSIQFDEEQEKKWAAEYGLNSGTVSKISIEEPAIQVIELKDSILLLEEQDITMGIYYDVIGQRLAGFHYFYE